MTQALLLAALEQAERTAPVVQAAAFLHAARVLSTFAPADAQRVLERGIALAEELEEPDRAVILSEAIPLAATVSPPHAIRLARTFTSDPMSRSPMRQALLHMLSHGHVAAAVEYLCDPATNEQYPYDAASQTMARVQEDTVRRRILRAAISAMETRGAVETGDSLLTQRSFSKLFSRWWRLLPADEAIEAVREVVRRILVARDGLIRARVNDVDFSSIREHQLFQIFAPLRWLDPVQAEALIREHPQLAAATAHYPYGLESIEAAAQQSIRHQPSSAAAAPPPHIMVGGRLIPVTEALVTGFREAFELALRRYAVDSDPSHRNDAPQECWPSAQEFRSILYQAGRYEGQDAVRHLERIPDPVLRLFAQIELAAALAGVPQIGGASISPGPHGFRRSMAMATSDQKGPTMAPAFAALSAWTPAKRPPLTPSYHVHIAPTSRTRAEGVAGGSGPDYWMIQGATLRSLVAMLYDTPQTRIDISGPLETGRFDVVAVLPKHVRTAEMIRLVREGIQQHFHLTHEDRTMVVDVLSAPDGIKAREAPAADSLFAAGSIGFATSTEEEPLHILEAQVVANIMDVASNFSSDSYRSTRIGLPFDRRFLIGLSSARLGGIGIHSIREALTMNQLCEVLECGLDRPLVNETSLSGRYGIDVHTEATSTREFLRVVCDTLGLIATPARRVVSTTVVRQA